jgi:hypothetical protein
VSTFAAAGVNIKANEARKIVKNMVIKHQYVHYIGAHFYTC